MLLCTKFLLDVSLTMLTYSKRFLVPNWFLFHVAVLLQLYEKIAWLHRRSHKVIIHVLRSFVQFVPGFDIAVTRIFHSFLWFLYLSRIILCSSSSYAQNFDVLVIIRYGNPLLLEAVGQVLQFFNVSTLVISSIFLDSTLDASSHLSDVTFPAIEFQFVNDFNV